VVDAALLVPEPALEQVAVLAQVVQKTRNIPQTFLTELSGEGRPNLGNLAQMLANGLPFACGVAAVGEKWHPTMLQQTLRQ
jgi:hypothetical protein